MKIVDDIEQGSPEWLELRKGKITGTRLGDLYAARAYTKADIVNVLEELSVEFKKSATKDALEADLSEEARVKLLQMAPKKLGFYDVIADHLSLDRDDENRMDRGLRLEEEAAAEFEKRYNKKVDHVAICISDIHPGIINSPDGLIKDESGKYTEAIEIKCLSPARHLQGVIENKVPDEYWTQKLQYFVVNPDLQKLYWIFYDPGIVSVPFHVVEVTREELGNWPAKLLEFQVQQLREIDEWVERLAF